MLTIYVNKSIEMGSNMFSLKKISYIVYFIAIVSIFVLLYYGGYYYAINNMKSDNLITKDEAQISNPGVKTDDYTEVNNSESNVILSSARYIIEEYNSDTDELTKKEEKIPVDYIGLTREQVIDYLTTYVAKNKDETLQNVQLVAFSPESLIIRKTVCNPTNIYNYFVISENNIIMIYNANHDKLFIDTGIDVSNIEEQYKEELKDGFYIETIHDLYNYLESITS